MRCPTMASGISPSSRPAIVIRPPVGRISRASSRASSFLPLPLGPMTATCSSRRMLNVTASMMRLRSSSASEQIADRQLALQPRDLAGLAQHQLGIGQPGRLKLFDDLLVFDPRVLFLLIEIEQFLPRRGHVLVGRQHRDQRAERQIAADYQIAADRIEEERRQLSDEVVEKLDEEFALIDLEADVVDAAEQAGEIGQLQLDRVVGMDFDDAGRRFLDAVGDDPLRCARAACRAGSPSAAVSG